MALPDKYLCQVIASLTPDTIDILFLGREKWRIPAGTVPTDLRFPNVEFWLGWDSENFYIYRKKSDSLPTGVASQENT
jgi:hypothetical protein